MRSRTPRDPPPTLRAGLPRTGGRYWSLRVCDGCAPAGSVLSGVAGLALCSAVRPVACGAAAAFGAVAAGSAATASGAAIATSANTEIQRFMGLMLLLL